MHESIIINLRERFKALEDAINLNERDFASAAFEYASYIGTTKELSDIVKELANNFDIDRKIFYRLFMYSTLREGFRNKFLKKDDVGMPLFYDKEIEAKFGLMKEFREMLMLEDKRLKESKKKNISIFEVVMPEDKEELTSSGMTTEKELFEFRILHNAILSRATTHKTKGVFFDAGKGILFVGSFTIEFRKFTEQYHCLRIIFANKENIKEEWMFSEIAELLDRAKDYNDKNFHNYFSAIKRRISAETGIKDLLITTNQSVKINEDYL